jgi:predicted alpha/beta superfamily hydrolase
MPVGLRNLVLSGLLPAMLAIAGRADAAPAPGADQTRSPAAAPFEIERSAVHELPSAKLGRTYELYVKTPPGYDKPDNARRRYPVLYLTDGPYAFQVASGISRVPFNQGRLTEFIIVGLSYARGEIARASRTRDYTPVRDPTSPELTGGAPAYLDHLAGEVLPMVERLYRVDPAHRILSGQSFGGLFGLWVALTRPDLFSAFIVTSPSIWWEGRSLLNAEADYAARNKDLKATLYLATGSLERPGRCRPCQHDMVADQQELVRRLRARKYPGLAIRSEIVEGTIHELTFPVGLAHALQWMFYDQSSGHGRGDR